MFGHLLDPKGTTLLFALGYVRHHLLPVKQDKHYISKTCLLGRFPLIFNQGLSVLLPPEGASFCQPCFSTCRLTEDSGAANTQDYRLCMAKDRGDFIASWAFHVHKVGIGALHQALFLVFPLLLFWRGMKEILCELKGAEMQRLRR